ncbi:MAG TPA: NAD-dependent epimerase/dehydratase family protein [Polyangiaceae bacterium]|nr:NAD-dependent epimerase/dehydratase family protein [Polyangiaceae bacterium]
MRALVIGGTGFVGMNLIRALRAAGHDVSGTRRVHCNTLFARRLGAPLVTAELDDVDSLTQAMRGKDVVFNCAGHYPRYSLDREAELAVARRRARNTLEAARRARVARYVLTSSIATVGPPEDGARYSNEADRVELRSLAGVYHSVKAAIEDEVCRAARSGLDVVTTIPTAIFGELDVKAGTGFLIVAVGNRALPFSVDGPINVVDADDLARAHILAAERGATGQRYIIGGHNLSVSTLLCAAARLLAVPLEAEPISLELAGWRASLGEARTRAARAGGRAPMSRELIDIVRFGRHVQNGKAEAELGLPPATPLLSTLKKSCDWYVRHRYIRPAQGARHVSSFSGANPNGSGSHHPPHST